MYGQLRRQYSTSKRRPNQRCDQAFVLCAGNNAWLREKGERTGQCQEKNIEWYTCLALFVLPTPLLLMAHIPELRPMACQHCHRQLGMSCTNWAYAWLMRHSERALLSRRKQELDGPVAPLSSWGETLAPCWALVFTSLGQRSEVRRGRIYQPQYIAHTLSTFTCSWTCYNL